jgi:hypothetical protein
MESNNVFNQLKSYLQIHEKSLSILHDKSDNYYLNTPINEANKKSEFFGAVQIKKSYVAYHLMPIYCFPELLENISEELKSKMQGKSCFNFKEINEKLFEELNSLTLLCFEKYQSINKV